MPCPKKIALSIFVTVTCILCLDLKWPISVSCGDSGKERVYAYPKAPCHQSSVTQCPTPACHTQKPSSRTLVFITPFYPN